MQLSNRLKKLADMVSAGNRLADIGTDHGFVPIYLVENKKIPSAIAMDIGTGPLKRATEHVAECGLSHKIETRLSNGLEKLTPGEADTVLIAGMGGNLIVDILEADREKTHSVSELVLSPHTDWDVVRRYLITHDFNIIGEDMLEEEGKYYIFLKAVPEHTTPWSNVEYRYGKRLLQNHHPVLKAYLQKQLATYEKLIGHIDNCQANKKEELAAQWQKEVEEITGLLNKGGFLG
jgi:tRNA (adenine22-N1)-methyltransferase